MSSKTAYVWGPISNFSAALIVALLENGWNLHIACKSALQISLSPLDLASSAQNNVEKAAGGADKVKQFSDNLTFLESDEPQRGTTYDIIIFNGLPTNYDEARVSRAPWAADELIQLRQKLKSVPMLIVSSLWGGVQNDGVVPEEIEFERRKPRSHFEGVCQQYEKGVLKAVSNGDGKWHFVRLPLILGNYSDGRTVSFTGLYKLLQSLSLVQLQQGALAEHQASTELSYNPDATFWMLPCDWAANLVAKIVDDMLRPVICNVVSTQSTLNQEWIQELASAFPLEIVHAEKDSLNLPSTLRSMLNDNIQVKTRNLFEVLGRYHQSPMVITSEYFGKILQYAALNNWGQVRQAPPELPFSKEQARNFFQTYLPAKVDHKMIKTLAKFHGGIAFKIANEGDCSWLISEQQGTLTVSSFISTSEKPAVTFTIQPTSFPKLCSGKMLFEQALLTRALHVSGNPIESIKGCDFLRKLLKKYPLETSSEVELPLEGAKRS
jgi:hypothetical protein